jgi:hypothetical protein
MSLNKSIFVSVGDTPAILDQRDRCDYNTTTNRTGCSFLQRICLQTALSTMTPIWMSALVGLVRGSGGCRSVFRAAGTPTHVTQASARKYVL